MNRAAVSALVWGIYLIGAGLGFLFVPDFMLSLFRFSGTTEGWVRVIGLLVALLGTYYFYCAQNNVIPFIKITVFGRLAFALGALALVLLKFSEPPLLLIGATDALGALWTWLALRSLDDVKSKEAIARA
jgi:hypothetical protein